MDEQRDQLIRLDEQIKALHALVLRVEKAGEEYVTRIEFEPVRNVVYGLVGVICVGMLSAVIAMVIRR